jgi:hypothetical protein
MASVVANMQLLVEQERECPFLYNALYAKPREACTILLLYWTSYMPFMNSSLQCVISHSRKYSVLMSANIDVFVYNCTPEYLHRHIHSPRGSDDRDCMSHLGIERIVEQQVDLLWIL